MSLLIASPLIGLSSILNLPPNSTSLYIRHFSAFASNYRNVQIGLSNAIESIYAVTQTGPKAAHNSYMRPCVVPKHTHTHTCRFDTLYRAPWAKVDGFPETFLLQQARVVHRGISDITLVRAHFCTIRTHTCTMRHIACNGNPACA